MQAKEGHIVVKEAPRVVSEHDDRKLKDEMQKMEEENRQVAGDEPEDD
jgi:translation initiation factor 2 subunit 1